MRSGAVGYQASSNDTPHDKSFPTHETFGAQPNDKIGGAGALPGSVNESGVAAVPENVATETRKSLPTLETRGAQPGESVGGVGALPGTANETGVAKLPDDDAATGLPKGSAGAAVGTYLAWYCRNVVLIYRDRCCRCYFCGCSHQQSDRK